jgi:hypothetical protein
VLPLFVLAACAKEQELPVWMTGVWKSSFDGIDVRETWVLKGKKMIGSTVWSWDGKQRTEKLRLYYENDSLTYDQKLEDGRYLKFVCRDAANDTLVFVNNKNHFPKRLIYVKPKSKYMTVWIDNEEKDPNRISFPFKKVETR